MVALCVITSVISIEKQLRLKWKMDYSNGYFTNSNVCFAMLYHIFHI